MDPESGQQPGFLVYAAGRRISTERGGRQGGEKGRRSGRKIKAKDNAFDQNVVIRVPEGSYAAQWAYDHYYTIETFAPEYYITVSCSENEGTVSSTPSFSTTGTVVTLKAAPKEGYVFSQWHVQSGDVKIKNNQFTIGSSDVK